MDPTILILIAIIILIIILIIYLKKSKTDTTSKSPKTVIPEDAKTPPDIRPVVEPPAPRVSPSGPSGALYIPPEMLGDRRNEEVRRKVDETIRNFDWDADGGRSEFLYTLQLNKSGWICPYCEGENNNEDPLCMICGTKIGQ